MRPIKLEELVPLPGEFYLRATQKTYHLRPVSIEDRVWITSKYGSELQQIFREVRAKEIAAIAFHQLTDKDKADFKKKTVEIVDEEGNTKETELGGVVVLRMLIQGNDEITAVLTALLHTIGISEPLIEEMAADADSELAQKKNENVTGERSLTSLPANMDGASTKSVG
ncbi:MAG: hypothetical protein A2428_03120 [Bdellovibrionales bacterium RIFOXYC1_FULL_54_43]|nr:MAG: hypothetical protein A2428_03120 [Bdellovibrionales bacterium RIFOXYC1_FULL_54_43]OFZ82672.1 MAG: hypothetical protein A2603_02555 [Bdellovibrionales bacterium RIFOXYD1_FULL_55_31]